jgi:hypothetical protein
MSLNIRRILNSNELRTDKYLLLPCCHCVIQLLSLIIGYFIWNLQFKEYQFFFSNTYFRLEVNFLLFLLVESPASEFYVPTFRRTKFRRQGITQKKEYNIFCSVCSQREIQDPRRVQQITQFSATI